MMNLLQFAITQWDLGFREGCIWVGGGREVKCEMIVTLR
jgi:hypothetical protein